MANARNEFNVAGTFVREHGGPIRDTVGDTAVAITDHRSGPSGTDAEAFRSPLGCPTASDADQVTASGVSMQYPAARGDPMQKRTPYTGSIYGAKLKSPGKYGDWKCHRVPIVNGRCYCDGGATPAG